MMARLCGFLLVVLLWAPSALAGPEADLVLEVSVPASIHRDGWVEFQACLRNTSKDRSYSVVRPGSGSHVGWREPHVYWTARNQEGAAVPPREQLRCGVYDPDWSANVVLLKPGETLPLNRDSLPQPASELDFPASGRVQLILHYSYQAGKNSKGGVGAKHPLPPTPPFSLSSRSATVELLP